MTRSLLLPAMLVAQSAVAQPVGVSKDWPSAAQIDLVEQRRASFPVANIVEDVDWYTPQADVKGSHRHLPVGSALSQSAAQALDGFRNSSKSFALIVADRGKIRYENYAPGFGAQSRYDTASMHKAVVTLLLGAAVESGAISSVDDPLSKYMPELKDDKRGQATLRQLLEMSSGIRTPPVSDSAASPYWQTYFGDDLRQAIGFWPVNPEGVGKFYYANANTQYLAWAIERATGKTYADYLSQKIWAPIGASPAKVWMDHTGGSPRAFCCLQATARDWVLIGELIRNRGIAKGKRLVPVGWVDAMLAPSAANPNYGWNIWRGYPYNPERTYGPGIPAVVRAKAPFAATDTFYLDGSGGQRVYVIPSRGITIVRIGKPDLGWDDSQLPNLVLDVLPSRQRLSADLKRMSTKPAAGAAGKGREPFPAYITGK